MSFELCVYVCLGSVTKPMIKRILSVPSRILVCCVSTQRIFLYVILSDILIWDLMPEKMPQTVQYIFGSTTIYWVFPHHVIYESVCECVDMSLSLSFCSTFFFHLFICLFSGKYFGHFEKTFYTQKSIKYFMRFSVCAFVCVCVFKAKHTQELMNQ